ncbi:MAG: hypothetical protein ABFS86_06390 [Planctomycetota bacterium]
MSDPEIEFPRWCDLSCPHAEFPKEEGLDGSGSCRTFLALWCAHLGEIVTKNAPCEARRRPNPNQP